MGRTLILLERLTPEVRRRVERYREDYTDGTFGTRETVRAEMSAYAHGLKDAGAITEQERRTLFVYMTIPVTAQNRK